MSKTILLNHSNWHFTKENPGIPTAIMGEAITLPHTWNAVDGQDGGNDYYRGTCWYTLALTKPAIPAGGKAVLQLDGAAMTAAVYLNGEKLAEHKGGYSTFRVDLTDHLKEENLLAISVDNRDNGTVYPQKADFTFYGGIYRDVTLHIVPAEHFALPANGAPALKVTPIVTDLSAKTSEVTVEAAVVGAQTVTFALEGQTLTAPVEKGTAKVVFTLNNAHLWDGVEDPFLYVVSAKLDNGEETSARFGCRKFEIDPQKGFHLNGRSYPLRGVSRHQDRKVDAPNPDYAMDNRKNVTNWFDGELDESCWSVKDNMAAAMADPKAGPILKQIREKAAASRGDVAAAVKDNPALVAMMERAMQRMTIQSMLMQAGTSEEDIKQLNRVLQGISKE